MGNLAYGPEVFATLYNLFDGGNMAKLLPVAGDKYTRMRLENEEQDCGVAGAGQSPGQERERERERYIFRDIIYN